MTIVGGSTARIVAHTAGWIQVHIVCEREINAERTSLRPSELDWQYGLHRREGERKNVIGFVCLCHCIAEVDTHLSCYLRTALSVPARVERIPSAQPLPGSPVERPAG